jgi:hypothetical protein
MNTWNNYYNRTPFAEGVASTFDVCGNNSSFKNPLSGLSESQFITRSTGAYFQVVGKHMHQAINHYDGIFKNKKS